MQVHWGQIVRVSVPTLIPVKTKVTVDTLPVEPISVSVGLPSQGNTVRTNKNPVHKSGGDTLYVGPVPTIVHWRMVLIQTVITQLGNVLVG